MSFKVGIYEDLTISKAEINKKNSLEVTVTVAKDIDPLAALNASGSAQLTQEENTFLVYPFKNVDYQGKRLTAEEVASEIAGIKDPLDHTLQQFLTKDKISWDIFKGTGIVAENYNAKLTDQATLDLIYKNIAEQFIAQIKPFLNDKTKKLRGVFPRQSAAKHYPSLRKTYLESQPIFEPMSVPKEQSKIKFSKWEVDNKRNVPDAVAAPATASKADAAKANDLFAKK